jgi:hypothetical protein
MDARKAISELRQERNQIDQQIDSLERGDDIESGLQPFTQHKPLEEQEKEPS